MMPFQIVPGNVDQGSFYVRCSLYTENPNILNSTNLENITADIAAKRIW